MSDKLTDIGNEEIEQPIGGEESPDELDDLTIEDYLKV